MPAKTRLAQLIAREEGFGVVGAKPTRDHNPGDLEHAPGVQAWDGAIGIEPSDDQGWSDLERQLQLYAERGLTMRQMIEIFAPPNENNTLSYLNFVCDALGCDASTTVSEALLIPAGETT